MGEIRKNIQCLVLVNQLLLVQKKGCGKKCNESLTNERRQEIHDYYWSLNKDKQNIWISHMVETITPIQPRKKTTGERERRYTRVFHMENDTGEKITVCQKTDKVRSYNR